MGRRSCLGLLPKQGIWIPEERLSLHQGSLPLNPFTLHLRLLLGGQPYMDVSILTQWEGPSLSLLENGGNPTASIGVC